MASERKASERVMISMRLPPDILEAGKRRAAEQRRTFTGYVEWLVARDAGLAPKRRKVAKED